MLINDDDTPRCSLLLKIPYSTRNNFSKSKCSEVQHTQPALIWAKKSLKSMGLNEFQIIYPSGGAHMSRAYNVKWRKP